MYVSYYIANSRNRFRDENITSVRVNNEIATLGYSWTIKIQVINSFIC